MSLYGRALERWLAFQIHGRTGHARAPRRRARRGPARSWKYRAWIRTLPSVVSGEMGCDAAHTGDDGGMSMKASDYSCVPLTRDEHEELDHGMAGHRGFEAKYRVDLAAIVRQLNHDWFAYAAEVK